MLDSRAMLRPTRVLADTIVALATAPGEAAIAVVRLSGVESRRIANAMAPGRRQSESHRLVRATLRAGDGSVLDDAMVVEMHAPRSYTGEDVVELHLHGSRAVTQAVVERCCALGARLAEPGEYTLRAVLNGRMDLAQAEGVAQLIGARNEAQRQIATQQLQGRLSQCVNRHLDALEGVLASWQATFDFPEHDSGAALLAAHRVTMAEVDGEVQRLVAGARVAASGRVQLVLCGAPNVGKSTLLNAWAGEERVLVDKAPGTTRDPVEVELGEGLVRWSVWDTAGIRDVAPGLEARGITMARERVGKADLALWLVSGEAPSWPAPGLGVRVVGSKSDLVGPAARREIEAEATRRGLRLLGWVSAATGEGVAELRTTIAAELGGDERPGEVVVVRQRHLEALTRTSAALRRTLAAWDEGRTLDVLAMDLEDAIAALGEVVGRHVDAEVLDRIFAEFCLGK
ncbi:MAG: tRNA uridine-5-carboxymethylaminomethyl(34) synthesis GTPase MnmE [Myxococcota bacterium]